MQTSHFHTLQKRLDLQVLRPLGTGHFSHVYEVKGLDETPRALKVYRPKFKVAQLDEVRINEFAMATRVKDHRFVVKPVESGWGVSPQGPRVYFLMELAQGHNLDLILRRKKSLLESENMLDFGDFSIPVILHQLLLALKAVHDVGVLHMDIKPANIVIDRAQRLTLVDMGSATLAKKPAVFEFVPHYAAPEIIPGNSKNVGPWSDLFSVGRVLEDLEKYGLTLSRDEMALRKALLRTSVQRRPRSVDEALKYL